jgi:hypothetical protein
MDPTKLAAAKAAGKSLPAQHTSRFELLPEPTQRRRLGDNLRFRDVF